MRKQISPTGAVAWICTRDVRFVQRVEEHCQSTAPTIDQAEAYLAEELALWSDRRLLPLREQQHRASLELKDSLSHGVCSEGVERGYRSPRCIPPADWLVAESFGAFKHDDLAKAERPSDLRSLVRVVYERVKINLEDLDKYWALVKADFRLVCEDDYWNFEQLSYWITTGSHEYYHTSVPFGEDDFGSGGLSWEFPAQTAIDVSFQLRSGALVGFVPTNSGGVFAPSELSKIAHSDWIGVSPQRRSNIVFDRKTATKIWRFKTTPADRFPSKRAFIEHVQRSGVTDMEANAQAHLCCIADGR